MSAAFFFPNQAELKPGEEGTRGVGFGEAGISTIDFIRLEDFLKLFFGNGERLIYFGGFIPKLLIISISQTKYVKCGILAHFYN